MMMSLMSISGRLMAREVQYPWGEACWENLIFFIGSGSDIEDGEALNLGPISCLEGWHMCNCAIVHWSTEHKDKDILSSRLAHVQLCIGPMKKKKTNTDPKERQ